METATQEKCTLRPFITLICRACWRPVMLKKALRSVFQQTDTDCEIIFIVDMQKQGVRWANEQYAKNVDRIQGQYVYTLDDDTFLPNAALIANIKKIAQKHKSPHVIMVRGSRPQFAPKILPKEAVWKHRERLKVGSTNGACYIANAECWRQYAHKYGIKAAGDWGFLMSLRDNADLRFFWFDFIAKETQQLGRGKKFEKCNRHWWKNTVALFEIEQNDKGWHLPLYLWDKQKIAGILKKTK